MFISDRIFMSIMWRPVFRLLFFVLLLLLEVLEAGERFLERIGNIFNDSKSSVITSVSERDKDKT